MSSALLFLVQTGSTVDNTGRVIDAMRERMTTELNRRLTEFNTNQANRVSTADLDRELGALQANKQRYITVIADIASNKAAVQKVRSLVFDLYSYVSSANVTGFESGVFSANNAANSNFKRITDPLVMALPDIDGLISTGINVSKLAAAYNNFATQADKDAANAAIAAEVARLDNLDELLTLSDGMPRVFASSAEDQIVNLKQTIELVRKTDRDAAQAELRKYRKTQELQMQALAATLTGNPIYDMLVQSAPTSSPKGSLLSFLV